MLVLSRYVGEQIVIGGDVVVTVVEVRGDKVRLGIEADKATTIHRREVQDAIDKDAAKAAGGSSAAPHI